MRAWAGHEPICDWDGLNLRSPIFKPPMKSVADAMGTLKLL